MGDPITRLVPRPRPVSLAGRRFLVREARLDDLADLQAWLDGLAPDPADGLDGRLAAEADPVKRDRLLFDAYGAADAGGPCYSDRAGAALLASQEGLFTLARVALARCVPVTTDDDLADLVLDATPCEWEKLRRVFFGLSVARDIERRVGCPREAPRGRSVTWGEAVDDLARSHHWTYAYIYSLTLTEFSNARRGGKPGSSGFKGPPAFLEGLRRRMLAAFGRGPDAPAKGPTPNEANALVWVKPAKPEGVDDE